MSISAPYVTEHYLEGDALIEARGACNQLPEWTLTPRQLCDAELLLNGAFTPLTGFLGEQDYNSVVESLRLSGGTLWPIPVTLDVSEKFAADLTTGQHIVLRDGEGAPIAMLEINDIWRPDREQEARQIYGTTDQRHPGVSYLRFTSAANSLASSLRHIMISCRTATARMPCAKNFIVAAGAVSQHCMHAIQCTVPRLNWRNAWHANTKPTW
jgi:sulfate adenylyltransferase